MPDHQVIVGSLMEESWLTIEQAAKACTVDHDWLLNHLQQGLLPHAECVAGVWRFSSAAILHAKRMHHVERDFDAVPELAALMADLLEELDHLRARLR